MKSIYNKQEDKMNKNPHWQRLIDAHENGTRITIQQKAGDPLVNVKVISTEDGVVIESESGHTRTIDIADIRGVETLEIVEETIGVSMAETSLDKLSRLRQKITAIETRLPSPRDFFRVKRVVSISANDQRVVFIDHEEHRRRIAVGNIVHVYVN